MDMNKMSNEQNELLKKIKKIRIFGEFLIALGRHKIIFKQPYDKKHYTLNLLQAGMLDIHETIEGKEKKYPRTEKLDLKKLSKMMETLREELPNILEQIDINNPKYRHIKVFILPEREVFEKATKRRRKEIEIKKNRLVKLMKNNFVPMKDLQDYDFKMAFLLEGGKEYVLYRGDEKYFLLKLDDLEMLMNKIFERSRILQN